MSPDPVVFLKVSDSAKHLVVDVTVVSVDEGSIAESHVGHGKNTAIVSVITNGSVAGTSVIEKVVSRYKRIVKVVCPACSRDVHSTFAAIAANIEGPGKSEGDD